MQSDLLRVIGINSKGYGLFPKIVAQDKRLTIEAKAIYAYFVSYAGSGNTAFPSVGKIISDLGISKVRYYKHFNQLVKYGYISTEQIKTNGKFDHNIYTLNMEIPDIEGTSPCTRFGYTENGDTGNDTTNINSLKINSINKKIKNKKEKRKPETRQEKIDKWKDFYL